MEERRNLRESWHGWRKDLVSSISLQNQRDRLTTCVAKENAENEEAERKRKILDEAIANGHGIECGCCFGDEILVCIELVHFTYHYLIQLVGKHVPMRRRSSLLQRVHDEKCRDETWRTTDCKTHLPYPFLSLVQANISCCGRLSPAWISPDVELLFLNLNLAVLFLKRLFACIAA